VDRPETTSKPNLGDQAAKVRAAAMLGTIVSGRYRITELLAMGGVGAVYLAEHVHMHKHVAVKVLHPDPLGLPDLVPRFEREAVAGAHIQHPNVAAATDFGKLDDGSCFLVLEYVKGTTLREVIRRGPMSARRAAHIARQIAAGLGAAHAMGIVHRDIKPRNVMLIEGERDVIKIIDFGLAKLELKQVSAIAASRGSFDEERITRSGAVFGTIAYLAPEAALGMDAVDARADLYALGIVLYEMLAGKHPFDLGDPVALFRQHHQVKPQPIAKRAPGVVVPPELEAVVMKLLEKAPDARFSDAPSVAAALDAAVDSAPPSSSPLQLDDAQAVTMGGGPPYPPAQPVFPGPSLTPPAPGEAPSATPLPPPSNPSASPGPVSAPVPMPAPAADRASATPAVGSPSTGAPRWPYAAAGVAGLVLAALVAAARSAARSDPAGPLPSTMAPPAASATTAAPSDEPARTQTSASSAAARAAPAASAPAAGSADAPAARLLLRRAAGARDWVRATEAFYTLVDHDPAAFRDAALLGPARDLAAAMAPTGGDEADRMFEALANRAGSGGLDVLYEIVRTRGGSKAAKRALDLLSKPEVLARATPELRATVALRTAACSEMPGLLDRAAAEGDARTLVVMQTVAPACLGRSEALRDAQRALMRRLRESP
jgi:serine/threonine-protein kinase